MTHEEFKKELLRKMTLKEKIRWYILTLEFTIKDFFYRYIGHCPHNDTFGKVGAKWHYCFACRKKVHNDDYKAERRVLNENTL